MDTKKIKAAKQDLAKRVAALPAKDVWTLPAMEEKVTLVKLAISLIASGDRQAQRFVVAQIRACRHAETAGHMALALVGDVWNDEHGKAPLPARPEVLRELEPFLKRPSGTIVRAAARAVLRGDPARAHTMLAPFLGKKAVASHAGRQRFIAIVSQMSAFKSLPSLIKQILQTAAHCNDRHITNTVRGLVNSTPECDEERANLLALDVSPEAILNFMPSINGRTPAAVKRRKRLLPLLQAVAARLRDDPSARPRLEAAEKGIGMPGALLSTTPIKPAKLPPKLRLKRGAGTDGGPLLALPKEALASWRGTLLPDGKPAVDDFSNTDYGRACDVSGGQSPWGPYGFLDVGKHRGLVLGRGFEYAKLEDGTWLLVMEGDGESVAALLNEKKRWKKLEGKLVLPSGKLVVFDAAMEQAKTKNKSTLELVAGRYAVEEYEEDDERSLWIVRLKRSPKS
jgi:hypothetical protein